MGVLLAGAVLAACSACASKPAVRAVARGDVPVRLMLATALGSFVPYGEPWPEAGARLTLVSSDGVLGEVVVEAADHPGACHPWSHIGRLRAAPGETREVVRELELEEPPPCYYTGSGCYGSEALMAQVAAWQQRQRAIELPEQVFAVQGVPVPDTARTLAPHSFPWPRNDYMALDLDGDGAPEVVTESALCPDQPGGAAVRCYDTWLRSDVCAGERDGAFCRVQRDRVAICDDPGA